MCIFLPDCNYSEKEQGIREIKPLPKNGVRVFIQKFALQTSLLTAHSHYIANVRKKVKSEVETSSLTFFMGEYLKNAEKNQFYYKG